MTRTPDPTHAAAVVASSVADGLSEVVFELDLQLRCRWLSAAYRRVFGTPPEALLGRPLTDIAAPRAQATLRQVLVPLAQGEVDHVAVEVPTGAAGAPRWLEVRVTARRDEAGTLLGLCGLLIDVTARRGHEVAVARMALHDSLTGLANRSLLADRIAQALVRATQTPAGVAVLFIDLDHFKVVNDTLGHEAGDALLVAVAARLSATARGAETVARVGGDEFVVVAEGLRDRSEALVLAKRIQEALGQPISLGGVAHRIQASIGVASVGAGEHRPVTDLLAEADLAMYRAKERGRNRVELFHDDLRVRNAERMNIEAELRQGLAEHRFEVFYQPVVALADGRVEGAEALIRWHHPQRGLVGPAHFIPIAEATALIGPLTELVLATALREFAPLAPLTVAVNVSAHQLVDTAFPAAMARHVAESGIDPARITLEITETAVLADPEVSRHVLNQLRQLGVTLALDDFGTGYSALAHLQQLPVGCVKIDRSFVEGLTVSETDRALVRAVAGLAAALGLRLVAEGVEQQAQADLLEAMGCPSAQGSLFSPPLPFPAFLAFLQEQ